MGNEFDIIMAALADTVLKLLIVAVSNSFLVFKCFSAGASHRPKQGSLKVAFVQLFLLRIWTACYFWHLRLVSRTVCLLLSIMEFYCFLFNLACCLLQMELP